MIGTSGLDPCLRRTLGRLAVAAIAAWATTASAQPGDGAASNAARRAEVADIEPAVDFGAAEPRVAPRGSRPSSVAPAPAEETPATPATPRTMQQAGRGAAPGTAPISGQAVSTLDLGTTSITGNQELPKVLYIVPWKRSDLGDLVGRPVNTLLDEVLAPVDPEEFERHLRYYDALYGAADGSASDATATQRSEE